MSRKPPDLAGLPPVLKMPPDLTIPALRVLDRETVGDARKAALCALRPEVDPRTLLNAYVLPSLTELRFFRGSLRSGEVTRVGHLIAEGQDADARVLVARQLLSIDTERVHLVEWMQERTIRGIRRRTALANFVNEKLALVGREFTVALDRLGKWAGFLVWFGIVREAERQGVVTWAVNARHVDALRGSDSLRAMKAFTTDDMRELILDAYARASMRLGTRLYLPISEIRDEIGALLLDRRIKLLDSDIDKILMRAPKLLPDYTLVFSPFSGPAEGGLRLDAATYVGFMSLRPRNKATAEDDADPLPDTLRTRRRRSAVKGRT